MKAEQLSRHRQTIRNLIGQIDRVSSRCLYSDPLIHGTPAEVFRKCGKKTCRCASDPKQRHGPYKVIQVIRDGKSRQVCLRRDQEEKWQLARNYQFQMEKLAQLRQVCQELQKAMSEVIEKRLEPFP